MNRYEIIQLTRNYGSAAVCLGTVAFAVLLLDKYAD
jgi:hypothetical protein